MKGGRQQAGAHSGCEAACAGAAAGQINEAQPALLAVTAHIHQLLCLVPSLGDILHSLLESPWAWL